MSSLRENEDLHSAPNWGELSRENELKGIYPFDQNGISCQSDWKDEIFFTKYYKPAASKLRKEINIDTSVNIAKFFLSLYLGCSDLPRNVSLKDIYFSLLPSIKIEQNYIVDSYKATEKQVSISLSAKKISSYQFLNCSLPQKSYNTPSGHLIFSPEKIDEWFNKMISTAEVSSKKQHFINMVGFIMLNMLRLLRNEDGSVDKHLPMGGYKNFSRMFNSSFHEIKEFPFPPPHAKFYKMFHRSIRTQSYTSKYILAVLVQSFITSKDDNVLNFLNVACLHYLHGHGIGAIHWSSKVAEKTSMELDDVLSCFSWEDTSISVEKIQIFKSKVQPKSWPWSRLFDDTAYYSLSTAKNIRFCLVCAYAVINDHDQIPRMSQFRKVNNLIFNWASEQAEHLLILLKRKRDKYN